VKRHPYTSKWRDKVRAGAQSSAEVIAPLIVEHAQGACTAVDVGCGEGWLVRALESHGVDAVGVDGPWVFDVVQVDFAGDLPDLGGFDVVTCLEVAEHIPAERAEAFVGWLTGLAPLVFFSAAIPGQGGEGHVNEQWPAYWVDLFASHGFKASGELRWSLWNDDRVAPWYAQNLLMFGRHIAPGRVDPVVHPGMWRWHVK
jgi:SAM-dependent methyltransferase